MRRAILTTLLMAGCGLPIPTDGATRCSEAVFLEAGVTRVTCDAMLSAVRNAEQVTGADLSHVAVEAIAGETLAKIGYPNAWGYTQAGTMGVVEGVAVATVIHEALHARYGESDHCNWSTRFLPLLEANYVPGSFDDLCAHVHCTSTNFWRDATGQGFGNKYVCTSL